jgi:tellurite resistance protein TerC
MTASVWLWVGFASFILAMLALDLGVFHRNARTVSFKEALSWTATWVTLALLFGIGVWYFAGSDKALEFYTGWLIEYSLSVDNVFIFALIFSYFAVPPAWQHKVLFWGILGALVMRFAMIGAGAALVARFHWLLYVFGVFLIFTGIRMAFRRVEQIQPERNPIVRWFRKCIPVTRGYREDRFVVHESGRWFATPLAIVLVCVEATDLMFATDSIPAIFAVTLDPFILYTSNVFAILGLRSLYFVLAGAMNLFHHLKLGLGVVLAFIGVKILLAHSDWKIETLPALFVVAAVLTVSVISSLVHNTREYRRHVHARLLPDRTRITTAKTCETTNTENRHPGNQSASAAGLYHDVASQESRPSRSSRSDLGDIGSIPRTHRVVRASVGRD